jgi:hypothetical protein
MNNKEKSGVPERTNRLTEMKNDTNIFFKLTLIPILVVCVKTKKEYFISELNYFQATTLLFSTIESTALVNNNFFVQTGKTTMKSGCVYKKLE